MLPSCLGGTDYAGGGASCILLRAALLQRRDVVLSAAGAGDCWQGVSGPASAVRHLVTQLSAPAVAHTYRAACYSEVFLRPSCSPLAGKTSGMLQPHVLPSWAWGTLCACVQAQQGKALSQVSCRYHK